MTPKEQKLLKEFGKNMKQLRLEKGMSTREFALEAGIAHSAVTKFEAGETNPSLTTLIKIADALGVDLTRLISRK